MKRLQTFLSGILLSAVLPASAHALSSDQLLDAMKSQQSSETLPPDLIGGDLFLSTIGDDYFVTLALKLNFDRENWGIGLNVPIRMPLEPKEDDIGGFIRKEDWDEGVEFLKAIRYVYLGQRNKKGPFYIRIGELTSLTIGHGTILKGYTNGFDPNTFRIGTNLAVNVGAFGAEALVGDLGRISESDPIVAGVRLTARPLKLAMGEGGLWDRLVLGASVIADPSAPYQLKRDAAGEVVIDDTGQAEVANTRQFFVSGVDLGIEIFRNDLISIEPYMDLNFMSKVESGWGAHAGILWGLRIPAVIDTLMIDLTTEYRYVASNYRAQYFDALYELERVAALQDGPTTTKLALIRDGVGNGRNGVFFDLKAGLPSYAFISGSYTDYDGGIDDGTLMLGLSVPALEFVEFGAFLYRVNVQGLEDLIKFEDERTAAVAQVKVPVYSFLSVKASYAMTYELKEPGEFDSMPNTTQREDESPYKRVDSWDFGVGFDFKF